METLLTYVFIALIMAIILLFCFIAGIALIYISEELCYAFNKFKRTIKASIWDLEWKLNHR